MRKALHEEVSKEITDKSVHIAVKMAKPVLDDFMKALSDAVKETRQSCRTRNRTEDSSDRGKAVCEDADPPGQGVSSIPLADEGLKDFQKIAKKYGVDFAVVKDKNSEPPIYTVFFKAKDQDAITRILDDYSAKQIKKSSVEKISVMEKLKKFKEIVAAIPKKVAEKKKERSR